MVFQEILVKDKIKINSFGYNFPNLLRFYYSDHFSNSRILLFLMMILKGIGTVMGTSTVMRTGTAIGTGTVMGTGTVIGTRAGMVMETGRGTRTEQERNKNGRERERYCRARERNGREREQNGNVTLTKELLYNVKFY